VVPNAAVVNRGYVIWSESTAARKSGSQNSSPSTLHRDWAIAHTSEN